MRLLPAACVLSLALLAVACGGGSGTTDSGPVFIAFATFQDASVVLGQADFTEDDGNRGGAVGADTLRRPGAPCEVGGRVFVPDVENNRVLGFDAIPATNGVAADFALGQADLLSNGLNRGGAPMADTLAFPWGVSAAGGRLFVSDRGNDRVLVWNTVPTATGTPADVVLGQPDMTTASPATTATGMQLPLGIHAVGTKLVVCDFFNNRVLIWNSVPTTNGQAADLVLGQADLTSGAANRGAMLPGANTLAGPYGVWSDGTRVAVADGGNHRVLVWNTFPTTNGQAADLVLGQAAFTTNASGTSLTSMDTPTDVSSDGTKLVVGDCENSRILIYDAFPVASNTAPTTVLGQNTFTLGAPNDDNQDGLEDGVPTARTLDTMGGFLYVNFIGTRLWVGDGQNHRALLHLGQ